MEQADYKVFSGTIDQAIEVERKIPEFKRFSSTSDREEIEQKLTTVPSLILIASVKETLAGYKVGYEKKAEIFYSWKGGVLPQYRGLGIAQALLTKQEEWVRGKGYGAIHVRSQNIFPYMLQLLIKNAYQIYDIERQGSIEDDKICFCKAF